MEDCAASLVLSRFEKSLIEAGFRRRTIAQHLDYTEEFLAYLQQAHATPETATPEHVAAYLQARLQRYRRKHLCSPDHLSEWQRLRASGIYRFLKSVQGCWPPASAATDERGTHLEALLLEYRQVLTQQRALSPRTIIGHTAEARHFLHWLPGAHPLDTLSKLTIADVDRYVKIRSAGIARSTVKLRCQCIRSLLRFLHGRGRIARDLAAGLIGPTLYRFEGIPSTIRPEQIDTILAAARRGRSPAAFRDYAMLILLARYGLRAGEVCRLRLEDIDWRSEQLWIRHSKTGARTSLPLLADVGQALLDYIRRGRPPSKEREVFLRLSAPRGAFVTNNALYCVLRRHLSRTGLRLSGRRGPHLFRHARAASLLRAGVSLSAIGNLLGHRDEASTATYLKLADQELRSVALALPVPDVSR
jgi:integrase/recombinase XerD